MKLKELPSSLWKAFSLNRKAVAQLQPLNAQKIPVLVSLTSIESRLATIHLTIRSLLSQTAQPEKIILWFTLSQQIMA